MMFTVQLWSHESHESSAGELSHDLPQAVLEAKEVLFAYGTNISLTGKTHAS
jgi:hypothetical protein